MVNKSIKALVKYAVSNGFIEAADEVWAVNRILEVIGADSYDEPAEVPAMELTEILDILCDYAYENGTLKENSIVYRDLFDTKIMGAILPMPSQTRKKFSELYARSPQAATDWYYKFSQDTNYIRRDRIAKDVKWTRNV